MLYKAIKTIGAIKHQAAALFLNNYFAAHN